MSFQRANSKPLGELIVDVAGWVFEAIDDPEGFVVVALVCAALCILGLIVAGIDAASGIVAGNH